MEALALTIADLELGPALMAWGAQTVQEIMPRLSGVATHVAVRGSDLHSMQLFRSTQLLRADTHSMLDLLPGGERALVVPAETLATDIPPERPLVIVDGDEVIGVLLHEQAPPVRGPTPVQSIDAGEVALREVKRSMPEFRRKGVPLIIDVRDCRVYGTQDVLIDVVQTLLADVLDHVDRAGGQGAAHVMVTPGRAGTWIVVEDRCGRLDDEVRNALADANAWCEHPTVRSFRRLKERVEGMGGSMSAVPGPFGVRTLVALPGPAIQALISS